MTCVIRNVKLGRGTNTVVAAGYYGGQGKRASVANHAAAGDTVVSDTVSWSMTASDINIAAGQLETGLTSSAGARFGSDNFFIGGTSNWLVNKNTKPVADWTPVSGTPDVNLYKNYRYGQFSYDVPLEDGRYEVTLGFLEPDRSTDTGNRVFDVAASGEVKIQNLDVLRAAGGRYRTAVTRRFTTTVTGGHLKLDFIPERGDAVVSNIAIHRVSASGAR
jgi:beta-galactosidase